MKKKRFNPFYRIGINLVLRLTINHSLLHQVRLVLSVKEFPTLNLLLRVKAVYSGLLPLIINHLEPKVKCSNLAAAYLASRQSLYFPALLLRLNLQKDSLTSKCQWKDLKEASI